jgi:ATP-dependent DNA ligase
MALGTNGGLLKRWMWAAYCGHRPDFRRRTHGAAHSLSQSDKDARLVLIVAALFTGAAFYINFAEQLIEVAPSGPQWTYEIKLDGFRMAARIDRGQAKLLTHRP